VIDRLTEDLWYIWYVADDDGRVLESIVSRVRDGIAEDV
jgi:hypothetical protein